MHNCATFQGCFTGTGAIHYSDVIMTTIASQITSLTIVSSTVYSGADQSKHQSSASLAFVWGIHRGPVNSPHKWPVTPKMFPFDDVIMHMVPPVLLASEVTLKHMGKSSNTRPQQTSTQGSNRRTLCILYSIYSAASHGKVVTITTLGFSTLRLRQNDRQFADDIFKCIFLDEIIWISVEISLKFVPGGLVNNISALVQIMAWRWPGDKPLSEPVMVIFPPYLCVTRLQWIKW